MNLSHIPLARGVRYGVFNSWVPEPVATAEKCLAYLLSRSRIKYFGLCPQGVAFRSCCAVHSSVGNWVTPICALRRVFSSSTTKIYHDRNSQSFATIKSQAQISLA